MASKWFSVTLLIVATGLVTGCNRGERLANPPSGDSIQASSSDEFGSPGDYVVELEVNGTVRRAQLHVPTSYSDQSSFPLVLNLHGFNSNASQQETLSQMSAKADEAGFLVAYPEGIEQAWHFGPGAEGDADQAFLVGLVDLLREQLHIDATRVYITGISNGAQMSNLMACEHADVFAAAAPVSGGYFPFQDCNATRPVPIIAFHGTDDSIIPYEGQGALLMPVHEWAEAWAGHNGCDAKPVVIYETEEVLGESWINCTNSADVILFTIIGKGHSWPGSDMPVAITTREIDATDLIWNFFAAHRMP